VLRHLLDGKRAFVDDFRRRAQQRARTLYSWDAVTDEYERLFHRVCEEPLPKRLEQR
jgi:hypothetical protein